MATTPATLTLGTPAHHTGLAGQIVRHPLVAYFALAFAGAWLFVAPILFSQRGLGLITLPDPVLLICFLLATYAGPTPAAFLVTWITDGKPGVQQLLRRMVQWRVGIQWYLLVIIGYPLVYLIGLSFVFGAKPFTDLAQHWPLFFTAYLPLIPLGLLYPGIGEEPGWRGFALPRLQVLYGPLLGSLILGTLHAFWHLPVYFIPGAIANGGFDPQIFIGNTLAIVAATIVWTWLFNNAKGSILFAMLFHATSNAASGFIPTLLGVTTNDPFFGFKIMAVLALIVIVATRGRLAYKRLTEPDAARPATAATPLAEG